MYKIYINETPMFLIGDEQAETFAGRPGQHLIARYAGKPKFLLNYIDLLEKPNRFDSVVIYSTDLEKLFNDFRDHFTVIKAAGGLVFNEARSLLMIFRRGFWDLPKGKIDEGESIAEAAIREVEEEAGISRITLGPFFYTTYHTYREKDQKRVLKVTDWYLMSAPEQALIPEAEEDIEKAEWVDLSENVPTPIYGNIADLLEDLNKSVALDN